MVRMSLPASSPAACGLAGRDGTAAVRPATLIEKEG